MNKLVLTLAIISSSFSIAQTSGKDLLNKVTEKMKSYNSLYSTFDYRLDNDKENIHDKQNGFIFLQGDKYNLNLLGINQIFDGEKVYTISDEDEEVTITSGENEDIILTPNKVLNTYKKGYKITLSELKNDIQYILLIPENKNNTKKVVVGINKKTNELYSVTEENNEGTKTSFELVNLIPNFPIVPTLLQYDNNKYKDYLITEIN